MKYKHLEIAEELLAVLANHWVLIAVFISLMGSFGETEAFVGMWVAMVVIPLYYFLLRKTIGSFPLFFILHFVGPAAAYFVSRGHYTFCTMYVVLACAYAVASIKNKATDKGKKTEAFTSGWAIVGFTVGMICVNLFGTKGMSESFLPLILAYFACYYIYLFLNQYMKFIAYNKNSTSNIPEKEIFSSGFLQTVIYTVAGVGVLFLSSCGGWFTNITGYIGKAIVALLRFLIEKFPMSMEDNHGELPPDDMYQAGEAMENVASSPMAEWMDILLGIILNVGITIFIGVIVFLLLRTFARMWKDYSMNKFSEEMMSAQNEVRENLIVEKREKDEDKNRSLFAFLDNKEKIRKIYKKRVMKEKSTIVGTLDTENLKYYTAKECCDKLDAQNLQDVYDKVRYSDEEVTAEDVKTAKS